jgi:hypothetical protein
VKLLGTYLNKAKKTIALVSGETESTYKYSPTPTPEIKKTMPTEVKTSGGFGDFRAVENQLKKEQPSLLRTVAGKGKVPSFSPGGRLGIGQNIPYTPGTTGSNFSAGIGQAESYLGGALDYVGQKLGAESISGVGRNMVNEGNEKFKKYNIPYSKDYTWKSWLDPEFYQTTIAQQVPIMGSLLLASAAGAVGGETVAAVAGVGAFGTSVLTALGATTFSGVIETLGEAGSTFEESLNRGMTPEEADNNADYVFKANLALKAKDPLEWLLALTPASKLGGKVAKVVNKAGKAGKVAEFGAKGALIAGSEGGEEVLQGKFQADALGDTWSWDSPENKQTFAIGAFYGLAMTGMGAALGHVKAKTISTMDQTTRAKFDSTVSTLEGSGVLKGNAANIALDQYAKTETGKNHIESVVDDLTEGQTLDSSVKTNEQTLKKEAMPTSEGVTMQEEKLESKTTTETAIPENEIKEGGKENVSDIQERIKSPDEAAISRYEQQIIKDTAGGIPEGTRLFEAAPADEETGLVKEVAAIFGHKVVHIAPRKELKGELYDFADKSNGSIFQGIVYLNKNRTNSALAVVGHEITHPMLEDEEIGKPFLEALKPMINKEGWDRIDNIIELYKRNGLALSKEGALKEFAADFIGEQMTKKDFWNKLSERVPEAVKKAISVIDKIIKKIKSKVSKGNQVEQFISDLEKARELAADALALHIEKKAESKSDAKLTEEEAEILQAIRRQGKTVSGSIRVVQNTMNRMVNEHVAYLRQTSGKGITQGTVTFDEEGDFANRTPRTSNNPKWYSDFYRDYDRKPSVSDLKSLAKDHLANGFDDFTMEVPPHEEFIELEEIKNVYESIEQKLTSSMEKGLPNQRSEKDSGDNEAVNYQLKSEAFKKWFGESKVVDKKGNPLVVYHGTNEDFNAFDKDKIGSATDDGMWGSGFYFTDKENTPYGTKIKKVYLNIKNPLILADFKTKIELADYLDVDESILTQDYGSGLFRPLNSYINTFASHVEEKGHDGIFVTRKDSMSEYIAFEPTQIKSINNFGTWNGENADIMYQLKDPFYSQLQRTISTKMPEKTTAEQVLKIIDNPQNVKPEEVKWSGLKLWLEGKEKVTKAEVMDFLRDNQLKIEEVEKGNAKNRYYATQNGEGDWDIINKNTRQVEDVISSDDAEDASEALAFFHDDYSEPDTKFSQYVLPGGEYYRELLFMLPPNDNIKDPANWEEAGELMRKYGIPGDEYPGETDEESFARIGKEIRQKHRPTLFHSSHWDEPNVLAHTRFNERQTPDGKKVFFVEEVQSDWHQKGRNEGYKAETKYSDYDTWQSLYKRAGKMIEENDLFGFASKFEARQAMMNDDYFVDNHEFKSHDDIWLARELRQAHRERTLFEKGVPDAPFRKTWHEFVLKRLIRLASENGFDYMAWTTGEQQAERYDLSKQLSKITYKRDIGKNRNTGVVSESWTIMGYGYTDDQPIIVKTVYSQKEMEDIVGKEIAIKIVSDGAKGELSGVDLQIGGEGMKSFYDIGGKSSQNIPAFLKKYGKQWGSEIKEIVIGTEYLLEDVTVAILEEAKKLAESANDNGSATFLQKQIGKMNQGEEPSYGIYNWNEPASKYVQDARSGKTYKQPALLITDAMKQSALYEGQALFQLKETAKGNWSFLKERGFSENVRTDNNMNDNIRQMFDADPELYEVLKNKDTLAKAQAIFDQGFDLAYAEWNKGMDSFRPSDVPLARLLANHAAEQGKYDVARQIIADIAEKLTMAGQFSQAANILRKADGKTNVISIQREIDKLNKDGKKLYGDKWDDVKLTDDEIKRFNEETSESEREKLKEEIGKRISLQIPTNNMEKFDAWRRIAMLLNPTTHVRNVLGNVIMAGMETASDTIGAGIEVSLQKAGYIKPGQRTKTIGWKRDKALLKMVEADWREAKKNLTNIGKYDIENLNFLNNQKPIFKTQWLEAMNNLTNNLLNKGDVPFMRRAYINALGSFVKSNGLTKITDEARAYAKRRTLEATFKQQNVFSKFLLGVKRKHRVGGKLLDAAIPFVTTPSNIAIRAFDYSPLGLMRTLFMKGSPLEEIIEPLAKGLTGSAVVALGFFLAYLGWARAGEKKSYKAEELLREVGDQPYSINTPFGNYTFDWAQPFAVPFAMGMVIFEKLDATDTVDVDTLKDAIAAGGDTIFSMSMLKGIRDFLGGAFGSPTESIMGLPISYIQQAWPTVFGKIARIMDPVRRSTYGETDFERIKNQWLAKTPGLSDTLQPRLDMFGREQMQGGAFEQLFSPGYLKEKSTDQILLEVHRLYKATRETDVIPKLAPYKFTSDGKKYKLSAVEITEFQRIMGQANYDDMLDLINSNRYKKYDDEKKVKAMRKINQDNYDKAKETFLKEKVE